MSDDLKKALDKTKQGLRDIAQGARSAPVPQVPVWTKEPPTQPGWYWAREKRRGEVNAVEFCVVGGLPGGDTQTFVRAPDDMNLDDFDLWAGPIQPPKVPG